MKSGSSNPNYKHGYANTRLYQCWFSMKVRASSREGCSVCPEWQDFLLFKEWADSSGYNDNLQLCRSADQGDYTPDNVRWGTHQSNTVESFAKSYAFLYKGQRVDVYNLREFCRKNQLSNSCMSSIHIGNTSRKSHAGYTKCMEVRNES